MHVVATAGHVDHGKSTLVRALTGADPDRLAEEHRRGLSIELGYCWTTLPEVGDVAFVDVPGHERFVSTMLAGVGPVPAVVFVVAADDPWMPQSAEHLAALDALGVEHGLLVVTRCDLADPHQAATRAQAELRRTTLREAPTVAVSAVSGQGMDELRVRVCELVAALTPPDPAADVRFWVDRCFHKTGAGTVVTGTLPAGRIAVGDRLSLVDHSSQLARVRGIQTLETDVPAAVGVARVALRLGGGAPAGLQRGSVLVTPTVWQATDTVDVRVSAAMSMAGTESGQRDSWPPERAMLHIGAASSEARCRLLGGDGFRLSLSQPLPLRVGDRLLLRDPGSHRLWGARVLDPAPPGLRRRGAARARALALSHSSAHPDLADELRRRGSVSVPLLRRIGVDTSGAAAISVQAGDWLLDAELVPGLTQALVQLVKDHDVAEPLDPGLPVAAAARGLGLPTPELVGRLAGETLSLRGGKVHADERARVLPESLLAALDRLTEDLAGRPFAAPDAARLAELGLDAKALAAASNAGRVLRVAGGVVLLPGADREAARLLAALPQPFTASQARATLDTTRRVALPLLDHLDRCGLTRRLPDDRRTTVSEVNQDEGS
ncbi:MAG: selenocysteine-specific translation elongation factor [Nocardioidaceae bacterium]